MTVCLALRGAREGGAAHRTVVHSADPAGERASLSGGKPPCERPTVVVLRPDDPELRPDGDHEAVTVTATVPAGEPGAPDDPWGAAGAAEAFADRMVEAAAAAVPGLRERLLWREVRTPVHTGEETGSRRVPAPALAGGGGAYLPAANPAPLRGLYFAGGWSHPGGGRRTPGCRGRWSPG
ncbi:phytoene dehydrogenase [Streptomyces somaliensis]|nr:phytoene dehydrogenase [Streptomyces somaliensis]